MPALTLSTGAAKQALAFFLSQMQRMSPAGQQITAAMMDATNASVGPTILKWQGFCKHPLSAEHVGQPIITSQPHQWKRTDLSTSYVKTLGRAH